MYKQCTKNKLLERGAQMEVTDVQVRKRVNPGNRTRAIVSVTFDNEFVVHGIRVSERDDGRLSMIMPRKERNGKFKDIAHPINQQTRDKIEKAVFEAYENAEDPAPVAESNSEDAE